MMRVSLFFRYFQSSRISRWSTTIWLLQFRRCRRELTAVVKTVSHISPANLSLLSKWIICGVSCFETSTLLLRPGKGAEYCDQFVCLSVFVSVCPRAYLWNRFTDLHEICCADPLWPWLSPSLAALRYVMYFQFCG